MCYNYFNIGFNVGYHQHKFALQTQPVFLYKKLKLWVHCINLNYLE
jgi:hypothetical protein